MWLILFIWTQWFGGRHQYQVDQECSETRSRTKREGRDVLSDLWPKLHQSDKLWGMKAICADILVQTWFVWEFRWQFSSFSLTAPNPSEDQSLSHFPKKSRDRTESEMIDTCPPVYQMQLQHLVLFVLTSGTLTFFGE